MTQLPLLSAISAFRLAGQHGCSWPAAEPAELSQAAASQAHYCRPGQAEP